MSLIILDARTGCPTSYRLSIGLNYDFRDYSENLRRKNHIEKLNKCNYIENRIYREELKESLGLNFFSPFQPEREFKVYKSCKCSQIICSRVH